DDNAYWEFGQPVDDKVTFTAEADVAMQINGVETLPNSPELKTVMRFTKRPGKAGAKVNPASLPLRINTDQKAILAPYNAVTVLMRVGSGLNCPKNSWATLTFDVGPSVRIPSAPATLIADGKWRNYAAPLPSAAVNKTFTGFTFSPSSEAFQSPVDSDGIE